MTHYYCAKCRRSVGSGYGPPGLCVYCNAYEFITEDEFLGKGKAPAEEAIPDSSPKDIFIPDPMISGHSSEDAPESNSEAVESPPQTEYVAQCVNHPNKKADCFCLSCGAPICEVCTFIFHEKHRYCPACATGSKPEASEARLRMAYAALLVFVMIPLLFAVAIFMVKQRVIGGVIITCALVLLLVGGVLGIVSRDSRRNNSPVIVVAFWMGVVALSLFGLAMLVGSLMK